MYPTSIDGKPPAGSFRAAYHSDRVCRAKIGRSGSATWAWASERRKTGVCRHKTARGTKPSPPIGVSVPLLLGPQFPRHQRIALPQRGLVSLSPRREFRISKPILFVDVAPGGAKISGAGCIPWLFRRMADAS